MWSGDISIECDLLAKYGSRKAYTVQILQRKYGAIFVAQKPDRSHLFVVDFKVCCKGWALEG